MTQIEIQKEDLKEYSNKKVKKTAYFKSELIELRKLKILNLKAYNEFLYFYYKNIAPGTNNSMVIQFCEINKFNEITHRMLTENNFEFKHFNQEIYISDEGKAIYVIQDSLDNYGDKNVS